MKSKLEAHEFWEWRMVVGDKYVHLFSGHATAGSLFSYWEAKKVRMPKRKPSLKAAKLLALKVYKEYRDEFP